MASIFGHGDLPHLQHSIASHGCQAHFGKCSLVKGSMFTRQQLVDMQVDHKYLEHTYIPTHRQRESRERKEKTERDRERERKKERFRVFKLQRGKKKQYSSSMFSSDLRQCIVYALARCVQWFCPLLRFTAALLDDPGNLKTYATVCNYVFVQCSAVFYSG